jgi:hypothetical protein
MDVCRIFTPTSPSVVPLQRDEGELLVSYVVQIAIQNHFLLSLVLPCITIPVPVQPG